MIWKARPTTIVVVLIRECHIPCTLNTPLIYIYFEKSMYIIPATKSYFSSLANSPYFSNDSYFYYLYNIVELILTPYEYTWNIFPLYDKQPIVNQLHAALFYPALSQLLYKC